MPHDPRQGWSRAPAQVSLDPGGSPQPPCLGSLAVGAGNEPGDGSRLTAKFFSENQSLFLLSVGSNRKRKKCIFLAFELEMAEQVAQATSGPSSVSQARSQKRPSAVRGHARR